MQIQGSLLLSEEISHKMDCIECEARDPEGVECGESKLAKMECSGSLTPRFVNKDYVTAEITYSTAQAHHEVLAWLQVLCVVWICELHL